MFDSPLHFCEKCKQYVALDQSRRECAREQDCRVATCPLERYFVGVDSSVTTVDQADMRALLGISPR